jgi:hypothetical protein
MKMIVGNTNADELVVVYQYFKDTNYSRIVYFIGVHEGFAVESKSQQDSIG